jgi:hypothetical protein
MYVFQRPSGARLGDNQAGPPGKPASLKFSPARASLHPYCNMWP